MSFPRRAFTMLTVLVAFAGLTLAVEKPAQAVDAAATTTSLSIKVNGNQLINQNGQTVRLVGVNRSGTEYSCQHGSIFSGPTDQASIDVMKSWGVNFVRVPLNEACWLDNKISWAKDYTGAKYRAAIVDYVNRLNANGIYTAVDLHFTDPDGPDGNGDYYGEQEALMANTYLSVPFWTSVAQTFSNNPAMMFELYNEPHDISWDCVLNGCTTYMGYKVVGYQTLVSAVRATGSTNPVIINGIDWGNDMSSFLEYLPDDSAGQLIAGQHLYNFKKCATVSCYNTQFKPVTQELPLVATEVGTNQCSSTFVTQFMDWMEANGGDGIGVWMFGTGECPPSNQYGGSALLQDWNGTPTGFGTGIKAWMLANQSTNVGPLPTTTTTTTAPPTTPTTRPPAQPAPVPVNEQATDGYRVVTKSGVVYGFGSQANTFGDAPSGSDVVAMSNTKSGGGYWIATSDGKVFARGDAAAYGDLSGSRLNGKIVAMTTTPSGNGYWLLGSDGGVFTFGDAAFYGSTGGQKLNKPALSLTPTSSGRGYWLVAGDGGVFTFGDATFFGSTGNISLNQPVVGMAANPVGPGYWLVAADGGVFTFGPGLKFYGSTGALKLNAPIVDMSVSRNGDGYRFVATDGGVFSFGNAPFYGSLGGTALASPVRDITN